MSANGEKGRVTVVCDSYKLYVTLAVNLNEHWVIQPVDEKPEAIIVALSQDESEPVVVLAQTALLDYIGHVPMLVISSRRFAPDVARRIFHLDFPFSPQALDASLARLHAAKDS